MIVRVAPHVLWIVGLALLVGGAFMLYALSFPYTDPSYEDLARISRWRWQSSFAAVAGTLMFIYGVGITVRRRRSLRGKRII